MVNIMCNLDIFFYFVEFCVIIENKFGEYMVMDIGNC